MIANLMLITLLACGGGDPADRGAKIANDIGGDATQAEKVLKSNGMNGDTFSSLMFEIAIDETLSRKYLSLKK